MERGLKQFRRNVEGEVAKETLKKIMPSSLHPRHEVEVRERRFILNRGGFVWYTGKEGRRERGGRGRGEGKKAEWGEGEKKDSKKGEGEEEARERKK